MAADRPPRIEKRAVIAPPASHHEARSLDSIVTEVKAFILSDIPARNKLTIELIGGIPKEQAAKIKEGIDNLVKGIEKGHQQKRGGEDVAMSVEEKIDRLFEDELVFFMHYDERHPSDNLNWLGREGDAFAPDKLHDVAGFRTDGLGVLPGGLVFRFDATTGAELAPLKKFWLIMLDIVTTGGFGNVPLVSVRLRGMPQAQSAGLINAPRVIQAASRGTTMTLAREILALKEAKLKKEGGDKPDDLILKDPRTPESDKERAERRIRERLKAIESVEEGLRTHEVQLQLAVQRQVQFVFFRDFAALHMRRVNRALYRKEAGRELAEDAGRALAQKQADEAWGSLGVALPSDVHELRKLQSNLGDTIVQLNRCISASEQVYEELVQKLYESELEQSKKPRLRRKRFARTTPTEGLVSNDPSHLALMSLLKPELATRVSRLTYKDFGMDSQPKTKTW